MYYMTQTVWCQAMWSLISDSVQGPYIYSLESRNVSKQLRVKLYMHMQWRFCVAVGVSSVCGVGIMASIIGYACQNRLLFIPTPVSASVGPWQSLDYTLRPSLHCEWQASRNALCLYCDIHGSASLWQHYSRQSSLAAKALRSWLCQGLELCCNESVA